VDENVDEVHADGDRRGEVPELPYLEPGLVDPRSGERLGDPGRGVLESAEWVGLEVA
jgi:hypothetical protein